jgi:hypothetical protein
MCWLVRVCDLPRLSLPTRCVKHPASCAHRTLSVAAFLRSRAALSLATEGPTMISD